MFLSHQPTKTVITGKSGSGKTTYFQRVLENGYNSYWKTIFVYDWQGEMSQRLNVQPVFDSRNFAETLKRTGVLCYDPNSEFEGRHEDGLNFFAKFAFESCKAQDAPLYPRLFACDEIQLLQDNKNCEPEIQTILQTGRRWGLDLVVVAQGLNELHNKFRAQSTERVTFQHEDPRILDVMWDWGFNPDEVGSLPTLTYMWRNDKGKSGKGSLAGVYGGKNSSSEDDNSVDNEPEKEQVSDG